MTRTRFLCAILIVSASVVIAQTTKKYNGPRPPKPDLPYLLHASTLVPTEESTAAEENRKDDTANVVNGAASTARTPLAEPIFILETKQLQANKLELFQMTVKNGKREVVFANKQKKQDEAKRKHLSVDRLETGLYKVEVSETLENGEYCLSPNGSQSVFCFQVY